ncbi:putative ATP-dependent DNA helicase [Trypoxylus dichotomus]
MANLQETRFNGLDLRKIDDVPELYRSVFTGYPHFNVIQSAVYNDVFYTDESAVVSSPTGSGKTVVFELAIIRLLLNWETETVKDYKIVYISPTKALCEERLVDWHKKFSQFGVSCISVTGDSPNVDLSTLINSKLIITTPEKWDSLTRRWRDDERIVRSIKLFMIDEIHLLNDETRGPTLEAIITRMKTIHSSCQVGVKRENSIRLIGVSATISNVVDIAEWFGTSSKPAKYFKFEDSMRPVRLQKIVQGYHYNPANSSPFKFDIMLSYKLHNVLLQHSSGKPSLIFCSTRKSVEMTCKQLIQNITIDISPENKRILVQAADSLNDSKMKETLVHGVACHHAGMLPEDRRTIETLFRDGNLPVLVTTSTLAMGVNLPAHLVVIKSTKYYANGEYKDYNESMLFQMIGRAGRPQFDTSAVAVIMTTAADKVSSRL